jgi:hypothetical protein
MGGLLKWEIRQMKASHLACVMPLIDFLADISRAAFEKHSPQARINLQVEPTPACLAILVQ